MDNSIRQPKKRFVGRRTADAQAQSNPTNGDVETTAVQKGMNQFLRVFFGGEVILSPKSGS